MTDKFLTGVDKFVNKISPINRLVDLVVSKVAPKSIALANYCGSACDCFYDRVAHKSTYYPGLYDNNQNYRGCYMCGSVTVNGYAC